MSTNEVQCPKCGGAMWDNRQTKRNPKMPDFKCRNAPKSQGGPGCDGVIWPPKPGQRSPVSLPPANQKQEFSSGPAIAGLDDNGPYTETGAPPVESGTAYSRLQKMFSVYDVCLAHVIENVAPQLNASDIGSSPESIAAMTATLYISAKDAGFTR